MLSTKSIGSGGGAAAYYENLAREDYYTAGGEPPGQWVGEYAREIGLTGEVRKGELETAFAGFNPRTGEQIANNAGEDHKAGWDLTFSAPKSLSTIWATADAETRAAISEAQQKAVERALGYASNHVLHQREGHAGSVKVEYHDGIAAATFEHGTSREGDPQLHTHALLMNLAENGKRIDFDTRWKHTIGAAYRAELAHEMQKLGFEVQRDGTSFKIEGVPSGFEKQFSTRREQIEAAMREHNSSGGKAAQAAALSTREAKGEVNRAELFERVKEVAREQGFDPSIIQMDGQVEQKEFDPEKFLMEATQQASTLSIPQLEKEMLQAAQGSMTIELAQAKLEELKQRGELIELRDSQGGANRWTTREMLEIENKIAQTAERMASEKTHGVSHENLQSAIEKKTLSDDQKQALEQVTSPDRISVIHGVAGAGKSYMLDAAREAWEKEGYTVRGAALAGKAAEGLQQSSGIESDTIHKTLMMLDNQQIQLDSKSVIVLDEAGMVGSRLFERLQQHVDEAGAKMVLVGDTQQLQPIDAGGVMRAIQERVGAAVMDDIRRQRDPEHRQIVRDFKDGKADLALDRLEKLGGIKTYGSAADARKGMAEAIIRDMREGKTSIGLAGTRSEVHQINQLAREQAQQAGLVSKENHKYETERGTRQFADGDRVIFLKNDRELGVKNGTTGTVEKASDGNLRIKLDDGRQIEIGDMKYRDLDHGYAMTVHKSQGVTADRAHLLPGRGTDQHSAYVGASRHRETVQIHGTKEQIDEMKYTASKSHTKDASTDKRYTPIEHGATPARGQPERPSSKQQIEKLDRARAAFDQRAAELRDNVSSKHADPKPESVQRAGQAQPEAKPENGRGDDVGQVKHQPEIKMPVKQDNQTKLDDAGKNINREAGQTKSEKPDSDRLPSKQLETKQPRQTEQQQTRTAKPDPKQAEQLRQLKRETQRQQQRQPERRAEQQRQLKAESSKQRLRQPSHQQKREEPGADRQRER